MFEDFDVSALDFGNAPDAWNAAADSASAYADGSALANMGDWQEFLPTEYDYSDLVSSLQGGGAELAAPTFNPAADSQAAYANGSAYSTQGMSDAGSAAPKGALSMWDKFLKGTGVADKNGAVDLSNPKTLDATLKLILGGSTAINALLGGNKPKGYASAADLRSQLAGPYDKFNPQQQEWANKFFNTPSTRSTVSAADMKSPMVRGYARGGPVGALELIAGNGGGQDDIVEANLAPGEYVFDADTVAAVGDGSNEAGAQLLDQWRQNLRQHKRSADVTDIPPQTGDLSRFMPQGGGHHGRN